MIDYIIERSTKRKSLGIIVDHNGCVTVRASVYHSVKDINEFVERKSDWIGNKVRLARERLKFVPVFKENSTVTILGKDYVVRFDYLSKRAYFDERFLVLPATNAKKELFRLLKEAVYTYAERKIFLFSVGFGFESGVISVKDSKSYWGLCHMNNSLVFNYKLAFVPLCAADYVIMHELCHTKAFNHGKRFYALLGKLMPDYRERKSILSDYDAICKCL